MAVWRDQRQGHRTATPVTKPAELVRGRVRMAAAVLLAGRRKQASGPLIRPHAPAHIG